MISFNLAFNKFPFLVRRCFTAYIVVTLIVLLSVDHRKVILKTLDYLQDMPLYLVEYAQGKTAFDAPKMRFALRYYQNLNKLFPQSAGAYSTIGFCYYHLGEYKKSIIYYKKAISLRGDLFGLYHNLGFVYWRIGRWRDAIQSFKKAAEAPPEKTVLYPGVIDPYFTFTQRLDKYDDLGQARMAAIKMGYARCYKGMALISNRLLQNDERLRKTDNSSNRDPDLSPITLYLYPPIHLISIHGEKYIL